VLAPDCGMKYLPPESAYGKLRNMVAAARELRAEFSRGLRTPRSHGIVRPGPCRPLGIS
jgi:hypothetical protein